MHRTAIVPPRQKLTAAIFSHVEPPRLIHPTSPPISSQPVMFPMFLKTRWFHFTRLSGGEKQVQRALRRLRKSFELRCASKLPLPTKIWLTPWFGHLPRKRRMKIKHLSFLTQKLSRKFLLIHSPKLKLYKGGTSWPLQTAAVMHIQFIM